MYIEFNILYLISLLLLLFLKKLYKNAYISSIQYCDVDSMKYLLLNILIGLLTYASYTCFTSSNLDNVLCLSGILNVTNFIFCTN